MMNVNNVNLAATAVAPNQYPSGDLPEIAFVGRSNVGKSSLINKMVNRKALARTSGAPGKTRTINFYNVEDKLMLVDLPGYGYAKTSKTESRKWGPMIETYLKKRPQLKAIIILADVRHKPSENDLLMFEWVRHYGHKTAVVATKADKLNRNELNKQKAVIKKEFALSADEPLFAFSVKGDAGKSALWEFIEQLIGE